MNNDDHGQGKGAVNILDVRFLRNLNLKSMALSFFLLLLLKVSLFLKFLTIFQTF